jgi:hypothetical protein
MTVNRTHGLRRSQADVQNVITRALKTKRWVARSDNWIAKHIGCSDKTVTTLRDRLESTSEIPKLKYLRGEDGKDRRRRAPHTPAPAPAPPIGVMVENVIADDDAKTPLPPPAPPAPPVEIADAKSGKGIAAASDGITATPRTPAPPELLDHSLTWWRERQGQIDQEQEQIISRLMELDVLEPLSNAERNTLRTNLLRARTRHLDALDRGISHFGGEPPARTSPPKRTTRERIGRLYHGKTA